MVDDLSCHGSRHGTAAATVLDEHADGDPGIVHRGEGDEPRVLAAELVEFVLVVLLALGDSHHLCGPGLARHPIIDVLTDIRPSRAVLPIAPVAPMHHGLHGLDHSLPIIVPKPARGTNADHLGRFLDVLELGQIGRVVQ